jgi:hypothetical protein
MEITNRENKLILDIESVTFFDRRDKKLPQFKNLTVDEEPVSIRIDLHNIGLRLYGNVTITKKEYVDNIENLENYLLENNILNRL